MSSTLTLLAATAWREHSPALAGADALLLPAATSAPDALVIAVDARVSQETSALVQGTAVGCSNGSDLGCDLGDGSGDDVLGGIAGGDVVVGGMSGAAVLRTSTAAVAAYAAPAVVVRTRKHVQGPPSRGTPV